MKVLNETSERTLLDIPPFHLHAIVESGSAKVGVEERELFVAGEG
jgi:hypothetical protein